MGVSVPEEWADDLDRASARAWARAEAAKAPPMSATVAAEVYTILGLTPPADLDAALVEHRRTFARHDNQGFDDGPDQGAQ